MDFIDLRWKNLRKVFAKKICCSQSNKDRWLLAVPLWRGCMTTSWTACKGVLPKETEVLTMSNSTSNTQSPADDVADLIKRHSVLTPEEIDAVALWITAPYLLNSFRVSSNLALISPEKKRRNQRRWRSFSQFLKMAFSCWEFLLKLSIAHSTRSTNVVDRWSWYFFERWFARSASQVLQSFHT